METKKLLLIIAIFYFSLSLSKVQIITTIAGNGVAGYAGDGSHATLAELRGPNAVVFDHNGDIYLADK
jgi:hypothetical protein